jgi:hypothetical protein
MSGILLRIQSPISSKKLYARIIDNRLASTTQR